MRPNHTHLLSLACIALVFAGCAGNSTNVAPVATGPTLRFTEAAGTFYKDYTRPQRPAISAIGADGAFSAAAQTITLVAKMAGPVFTGGPNYYVWGFDRGTASAKAAPFPDEPTVKFDAVIVVTADPANGTTLTGVINLLNGSTPQTVSPFSSPRTRFKSRSPPRCYRVPVRRRRSTRGICGRARGSAERRRHRLHRSSRTT